MHCLHGPITHPHTKFQQNSAICGWIILGDPSTRQLLHLRGKCAVQSELSTWLAHTDKLQQFDLWPFIFTFCFTEFLALHTRCIFLKISFEVARPFTRKISHIFCRSVMRPHVSVHEGSKSNRQLGKLATTNRDVMKNTLRLRRSLIRLLYVHWSDLLAPTARNW